jgi:PHS family inorganic phosphate transporter-like MFS transporter
MNPDRSKRTSLEVFEESSLRDFHWRAVFTSGMGFFTDAYDLFIIGTVTVILSPIWHLTTVDLSVLNATSIAASVLGALLFGRLMDRFGRKSIYGLEVVLLVVGAIVSAFAPGFAVLMIGRIIVGLGVGGDYPTSAVIMAEFSSRERRGFLVTMVFAMQGIGLLVGPLFAAALLASHIPHDLVWRLMLGFGALPAATVFYLRRRISEPPHFLVSQGRTEEAQSVVHSLTGEPTVQDAAFAPQGLLKSGYLKTLIGTAGSWFLIDVAFYGNGVSQQLILRRLLPGASLLTTTLVAALIFAVAALPGYFVAAWQMDRLGRKRIQAIGFAVMTLAYAAIMFDPAMIETLALFLPVYMLSYFFIEFGPNTTTFLLPTEVFPTNIRGRGHGLSAATGKLGAALGVFLLPLLLERLGLSLTLGLLAIVSFLGVLLTVWAIPEMRGRSLGDLEQSLAESPPLGDRAADTV